MENSDILRLRRELAESIRLADDQAVRRTYQDLLRAGCPRKEIMNEVISLATASPQRAHLDPQNIARSEVTSSEAKNTSSVAQPETHLIERVAEHLRLASEKPTTEATPPLPPEPTIGQSADGREHRELRSSGPRWTAIYAGVAITTAAAGAGGYLFFTNGREKHQAGVSAALPAAPTQEFRAPDKIAPAPMKDTASSAQSETVAEVPKSASAQASAQPGAASPSRDMTSVVVPAEGRSKEALAPAAARPATDQPTKGQPDPALLARGDASFAIGDLAGARRFYERAADAGDAQAALRLGQTYDPAFVTQFKAKGVRPDTSAAVRWYLRADKLGAPEAALMLRAIANDLGLPAPPQRQRSKR